MRTIKHLAHRWKNPGLFNLTRKLKYLHIRDDWFCVYTLVFALDLFLHEILWWRLSAILYWRLSALLSRFLSAFSLQRIFVWTPLQLPPFWGLGITFARARKRYCQPDNPGPLTGVSTKMVSYSIIFYIDLCINLTKEKNGTRNFK